MISVVHGGYQLEMLDQPFTKSEIEKPFIEASYLFFDAKLQSLTTNFTTFLEIEFENEAGELMDYPYLRISQYISDRAKKKIINCEWNFIRNNPDFVNNKIAKILRINDPDFDFLLMLKDLFRKIQRSFLKTKVSLANKFLYEPFILSGSPVILVAPMGVGKSLLSIWLSLRIQNGIPLVIGDKVWMHEHQKAKVLYLAFEGNEAEFGEKVEKIKNSFLQNEKVIFNLQEIEDFYFLFSPMPFYTPGVREEIRKIISVYKPNLIVFDSITSALIGKNEIRQAEYIFTYIKNVLEPRGIAALLIMHPSKQDLKEENPMPKGSILYMAYPRIVWYLALIGEPENGFEVELKSLKDNLGLRRNSYRFLINFEEDFYEIKLVQVIDENEMKKKIADYCLEFLMKNQKATPKEIAEYYNLSYAAVSKALERLARKNEVVKISRGSYAINKQTPTIAEGNTDEIPF